MRLQGSRLHGFHRGRVRAHGTHRRTRQSQPEQPHSRRHRTSRRRALERIETRRRALSRCRPRLTGSVSGLEDRAPSAPQTPSRARGRWSASGGGCDVVSRGPLMPTWIMPTGACSPSVVGPALPVTETAHVAPVRRRAPIAIASAVSALTVPNWSRISAGTPSSSIFIRFV